MRVVFMGTPDAAVPSLRAVADAFDVVAVYTRPDRPRGRGLHVEASPVKTAAEGLGIEVRQPRTLRAEAEAAALRDLAPDAVAVVAYGALLPPEILEVPKLGCVNVHFSLLPRWRGAAPVERAIEAGDPQTGVTTMLMDEGLDTGPILLQAPVDIAPDDTSQTLRSKLAVLGAPLLVRTLQVHDAGSMGPRPQRDDEATMAPKVDPAEFELDPSRAAVELERRVRAFHPRAFVRFRGKRLLVHRAAVDSGAPSDLPILRCGDGALRLLEVQPEGKRVMSGEEFVRGYRPQPGEPIISPV
jgi:methionyl-tRNA formyltransferase